MFVAALPVSRCCLAAVLLLAVTVPARAQQGPYSTAPQAPAAPTAPPPLEGQPSNEAPELDFNAQTDGMDQAPPDAPMEGPMGGLNVLADPAQAQAGAVNDAASNGALEQDPPGRVGRVRVLRGRASLRAQGQDKWLDAASNRPLTPGDSLYVGKGGRVRVQLGTSTVYVGSQTAISILRLASDTLQLGMAQGDVFVHVGDMLPSALVEIDMAGLSAALLKSGDYRLHRSADGREALTVWHGEAEARMGTTHVAVVEGQRLRAGKGASAALAGASAAAKMDGFDSQCQQELQGAAQAPALRYVSQDVVGYDDLDGHGTWGQAQEYGPVWTPQNMPSNWAPYRYGHWAYIMPWGWTWIDDAPWGFAPFHYGRWVRWNNAWSWAPGPMGHRPVYAPHLVTFLNTGTGSRVGWLPLGYADPFVPGYAASYVYLREINGGFVSVVGVGGMRPSYSNCGIPGAITVMPWSAWGGGVAVGTAFGTVGVLGPQAFGAAMPPGARPPRAMLPQAARPGIVVPSGALMHQPVMGHGPRPLGPMIIRTPTAANRPMGFQHFDGFHPLMPFRPPPVGHYSPFDGGHPYRPSVGHPGFGGHFGAPSYHGGGGSPGGGAFGMQHGGGGGRRH